MNSPTTALRALDLRCEYLKNPPGIDITAPRLNWRLESADPGTRGQRQTAYQVLVASSEVALAQDRGDRWDSGKVESDESLQIVYAGEPLASEQACWWKVRVWDEAGQVSEWSEPARWTMGLLKPEDWKAKWIGLDEKDFQSPADDHRRLPARMVRREFDAPQKVVRATAYMSGLGFSELYLNGRKVDDRIMDPTHSRYDKRAMVVAFDVTEYLRNGKNAIGVILGNGRFFGPRVLLPVATPTFGFPKLLFQMRLEYADGSSALVVSDENWKLTDQGPIRANSEFDGEEYDARMEQPGWDQAGFDDSRWQPAQLVAAPGGKLVAQMLEPMRVIETIKPVAIANPQPGVYVADFGQSLYGMVRIKVHGPKGTRVVIRTTFDRSPDGMVDMAPNRSALSTDIYTLKGEGVESWAPRFRGQGMRFVEITGWPGVPTTDDLEMLVVHSDLEKAGEFTCSNELVNKISSNLRRTVRMQERGVPMDPDRDERQAWLSVSEKTSETEGYLYNVAAFYSSFLGECRIDQREDGCVSDAGSYWAWAYTNDPCWPSVITTVPWSCHLMYGDRRIVAENYPMMKRWMEFLETKLDPDFIYRKGIYGDWVDAYSMDQTNGVGAKRDAPQAGANAAADPRYLLPHDPELEATWAESTDHGGTSRHLISTAYYYYNCRLLAKIADFLGQPADAARFRATAEMVAAAFNKAFFDPVTRTYKNKTQTAQVLPLAFGMVPPEHRQAVVDNLVNDILVAHQGHLSVGTVGIKWLMQTLTEIGRTDVAYTILTQTTRPGWGYMVAKDGTSIWERWDRDTRDPGMNGQSQTILAGYLGAWMYQALGGINYDPERPAFKHIILHPQPAGDLQWVKCSFQSLYGPIRSDWKIEGDMFHWKVSVPPNTTATVYIPTHDAASVREGGRPAWSAPGVKFLRMSDGAAVCEVESGNYEFAAGHSRL